MTVAPPVVPIAGAAPGDELQVLEIDLIDPNPAQPRRSFPEDELLQLAANLQRHGMKNPPRVTELNGRYRLIGGERRVRAARAAGWTKLTCLVTRRTLTRGELLLDQAVDNCDRKDLLPSERSELYRDLQLEFGWDSQALSDNLPGTSKTTVENYLSLQKLPLEVLDNVDHGELHVSFAFVIAKLPSHVAMREMRTKVLSEQLTADQLRAAVQRRTLGFGRRLRGRRAQSGVERGTRLSINIKRGTKVSVSSNANLDRRGVVETIYAALREALADWLAEENQGTSTTQELPVLTPTMLLELLQEYGRGIPELDQAASVHLAPIAPFLMLQLLQPLNDEDSRVRNEAVEALNRLSGPTRMAVSVLGRIIRDRAAGDDAAD